MMILFTQSTAVLHKYLNDELKILCLLQHFPEVAQNSQDSLSFPCSEKSLWVPYSRFSGFVATLVQDIQTWQCHWFMSLILLSPFITAVFFSALMLLIRKQEEHPASKHDVTRAIAIPMGSPSGTRPNPLLLWTITPVKWQPYACVCLF